MTLGRAEPFRGTSRFELLGQVGQGGGGLVYEALDRESNSRVAVKALRTRDGEALLHFKDEFRVIHDLQHPNLVTPKELFEEDGQWFFTMDYVDGADLLTYVRPIARNGPRAQTVAAPPTLPEARTVQPGSESGEREVAAVVSFTGPLDEGRLRSALAQLVIGLCALHAKHKVHRDVKPSNVLVTREGRVMILDFGIVSDLTRGPHPGDEGSIVGTILYMAPEQAGGETVTPAADWYAVGVMLYEALTGRLPFVGSVEEVLTRKIGGETPSPRDVAPDAPADLSALCVDLMNADPAKRPDGLEIMQRLGIKADPDALVAERTARFVGRRGELREMEAAFARTAEGEAVTLLVEGESGVGKSMLVGELATRVKAREQALVFRGRCYERASVPYKAVDTVIDDLARYLASLTHHEREKLLPDQASALCRLFPVLDTLGLDPAATLDVKNPAEARARMFELVRAIFANVAQKRRLVVVIEDLQWADADSLALLAEMLRPPAAPPLLLLASIRTSTRRAAGDERTHLRLERLPGDVRHLRLAPLPQLDARELVQTLLAKNAPGDVDGSQVDAILAETNGHPLFIDELVRHRTVRGDGAKVRLDEALWERASALAPAARRLLELVTVAGVPLPQQVVAQAAALDFAQLFDAVGTLRAAHFVRTSGVYKSDTVETYHDRVRESVMLHLDEATRREWHGRLALALEQAPDAEPEQLVSHWQGAGNDARAAECALRAADAAATALAFDHAASLYRLGLELRPTSLDEGRALKVKLAEALTNAGRGAEAARVYLDAAGDESSSRAIDLRRRAGEELICSGRVDEGNATFASVLEAMEIRAPRKPIAILLSLLFSTLVLAVRGLKWKERPEAEIEPRELLRIDCLFSAGCGLGMIDHVRGTELQLRTLLEAMRVGEPSRIARALAYYAAGRVSAGAPAFDRTMEMQKVVASMAKRLGQPFLDAMGSLVTAYAYHLTGQVAKGRGFFERTERILRDQCVGVSFEIASVRALLYRALVPLGALVELERRAESALREAEERGDLYSVVNIRTNTMSFLALTRDDAEQAQRELDLSGAHLPTGGFHVQHAFHLLAQSTVSLYRGDAARVRSELTAQWPAIRRSMLLRVQSLRIPFHDVRARACLILLASGAPDAAPLRREVQREVRALEREELPFATALAHVIRGSLASLDGDRAGAVVHLAAADQIFTQLHLELLAAVARRARGTLLGEAGSSIRSDGEGWMIAAGIVDPARMSSMYAPGIARPPAIDA